MITLDQVLISPIVTEKSVAMENKYSFRVHTLADKTMVKKAVKRFYGIDVLEVNVINTKPKTRLQRRGKAVTRKSPQRKAIVTVAGNKKISFNDFK